MKTWMTALLAALGLALAAPHTADAQIFKKNSKAAKVAGKAAGILGALTGTKSGSDATATPSADGKYVSTVSNGVTIEAPASAKAQFAFEGAYGDTATGYVKVIIKVTTQADQQQANFGSSLVAYDASKASASVTIPVLVRDAGRKADFYPNPVTDFLNIRTGEAVTSASVQVLAANGAAVLTENDMAISPFAPVQIDMTSLSGGMYTVILSYTAADGSTQSTTTQIAKL